MSLKAYVTSGKLLYLLLLSLCTSCAGPGNSGKNATPTNSQASIHQDQAIYTVRPGDTLAAIARKYSVSARQIQYRNGISNPRTLAINTRLYIPHGQYQVPDASSTTSRNSSDFIWPVNWSSISSEFGARKGRHSGTDLRAPKGTPIRAAAAGTAIFVGSQRGYGNMVILQHANGVQTLYAHTRTNLVRKGQRVDQGASIATVGRSGNASGYHVHFEYIHKGRKLDPRHYVREFYAQR